MSTQNSPDMVGEETLEFLGCTVDVVDNGEQALEAATTNKYDVILMDVQMPVMDGLEATRRLRAAEKAKNLSPTPVIALTANAMREDREECLAAGMNDFVSKPFTPEQLRAAMLRILSATQKKSDQKEIAMLDDDTTETDKKKKAMIDRSALKQIEALQRPGKPDIVQRTINAYLQSTPALVKAICDAAESDQPDSLMMAAHSLKSNSANLGLTRLSEICRTLEAIAKSGTLGDIGPKISELEEIYQKSQDELSAEASARAA